MSEKEKFIYNKNIKLMYEKSQHYKDRFQGRLLVPSHIRDILNANEGTEMLLVPDMEKSQVRMIPLSKEKTAALRLLIKDTPGSLARIANMLAERHVNIIMSESRTLVKGKLAEWNLIVDTSECGENLKKIKDMKFVKGIELL